MKDYAGEFNQFTMSAFGCCIGLSKLFFNQLIAKLLSKEKVTRDFPDVTTKQWEAIADFLEQMQYEGYEQILEQIDEKLSHTAVCETE